MTRLAAWLSRVLILLTAIEMAVGALFFPWAQCLQDTESASHFSGATYGTDKCDVVPPQLWRLLGPLEGLAGILICGLSTELHCAIFSRILGARPKTESQ